MALEDLAHLRLARRDVLFDVMDRRVLFPDVCVESLSAAFVRLRLTFHVWGRRGGTGTVAGACAGMYSGAGVRRRRPQDGGLDGDGRQEGGGGRRGGGLDEDGRWGGGLGRGGGLVGGGARAED